MYHVITSQTDTIWYKDNTEGNYSMKLVLYNYIYASIAG